MGSHKQGERPPVVAQWLIRRLCWIEDRESILDNLREEYRECLQARGKLAARWWYRLHALRSIIPFAFFHIKWRFIMIRNYLKIAMRNILRHKGYSFINIAGLALGLTCAILILMWVRSELSYDKFHKNANEICRVLLQYDNKNVVQEFLHGALPAALKKEVPEIVNASRLSPLWPLAKNPLKYGDKSFILNGHVADPDFFTIFSFPFVKGNPATALLEPRSVVITENTAIKLFGTKEALDQVIQFELWGGWRDVKVVGILKDFPSNSSIRFDFAIPSSLMKKYRPTYDSWRDICSPAYVLLQKGVSYRAVSKKIETFIVRHRPDSKFKVHLFPLAKVHLHRYGGGGRITYIYIFSAIGLIILVIAILNYMNLSTARSLNRVKEIGVRKVVGSSRSQLIRQLISESIVLTLVALAFSLILLQFLLPLFNRLLESQLTLTYSGDLVLYIIGLVLLTGVISGSYPGFYLSRFRPVHMFKGSQKYGPNSGGFRKSLVLTQFTISLVLIIAAAIVNKQLTFIKNKDLGYDQECIINLEMRGNLYNKWPVIKKKLRQHPGILSVTAANTSLTNSEKTTVPINWEGKNTEERIYMEWLPVDYDYLKTFNMRMAQGRFFSETFPSDAREAIILNQAAVRALGMESPLGKRFHCWIGDESRQARIVGVVKDFNFRSLHDPINPVIFAIAPNYYNEFYVKLNPHNPDIPGVIRFMEQTLKEFVPDYPFAYSFLDDEIARLYKSENRAGVLVNYGASLAIFIACLGLFGLASFDAELRTKEIGIRKVLGATMAGMMLLMSKEYLKWILLANLIAWPLAWFGITKWLDNFAFHTNADIGVFIAASMIVLFIALASVGYQVIRAASTNPVTSLRYE